MCYWIFGLNTEIRSLFDSTHESKMNASLIIFPVQGSQGVQFSNTPPPPNNGYVCGGMFGDPDTLGAGLPWPNTGTQLISLSGAPTHQLPKLAFIGIRVIPYCVR